VYALIDRMRVVSSSAVIEKAEAVLHLIINTYSRRQDLFQISRADAGLHHPKCRFPAAASRLDAIRPVFDEPIEVLSCTRSRLCKQVYADESLSLLQRY
jgi:hypothetical protein